MVRALEPLSCEHRDEAAASCGGAGPHEVASLHGGPGFNEMVKSHNMSYRLV